MKKKKRAVHRTLDKVFYELIVFPNPFNDEITIDLNQYNQAPIDLHIFNAVGQAIKQTSITNRITLDLSQFEKGIYFIRAVQNGHLLTTKKIIKG